MTPVFNAEIDLANKVSGVWGGFDPEGPDSSHCPEEAVDSYLTVGHMPPTAYGRSDAEITALMIEADPSMEWLRHAVARSTSYWPFDGTSPEAYGAHVLGKLERWLDDWRAVPRPTVTPYRQPPLPRSSRFDPGAGGEASVVANRAATLVLRANEDLVREWLADPGDGWDRLHLYADVGEDLGEVGTAAIRQQEGDPVMARD